MDERPEFIEIDLTPVTSSEELHRLLARSLDFPDFYGRNWAAFWDAITGLVEMPRRLRLKGWSRLSKTLPVDAESLRSRLESAAEEFPTLSACVKYD